MASGIEGNGDRWKAFCPIENSQTEQLEFDEVESRTCASIFNVKNDIIKVALKCIIAKYSEISLPEKDKYCIFLPIYRI